MFRYNQEEKLKKIQEVIDKGPYTDTWESLANHETPAWLKDSKFGIFIHWGLYSVAAFGNEWYSRNMYIKGDDAFEHHIRTYGPHKDFGYKDFIPLFRAEKFNAQEWVSLFKESGARYVVPVAEHHDGFQMYKSELSEWNAAEKGPCRDILGELTDEMNKQGLINGASTHRIEHWFFMGHGRDFESDITDKEEPGDFYWPAMKEANHHDLFSEPTPTKEFLDDWMIRVCELIDNYRIKELYFDWWIQHASAKPYLKKIAAYYYNRAAEWGKEVTIVYKHDAFAFGTATVDIERGQFSDVKPFYWQSDTSISKSSWGYTENNRYKKANAILCDLVDIVSKNGSLLLNVGPRPDGKIADGDRIVLEEIGRWMKVNSEAIYSTRPWRKPSEGPTVVAEGQFTDGTDKVFTKEDFRFTCRGSDIYAICLAYPADGEITIKSLGCADASHLPVFAGIVKDVTLLGSDNKPVYTRDENGLHISADKIETENPVVFRITVE